MLRRLAAAACLAGAVTAGLHTLRPPPEPTTQVVVAAASVRAGSVLRAEDLALVRVPAPARQPGALVETTEAVGRRTGTALAPGEALTATRLVPRSRAEGLPAGRAALHVGLADPAAADVLAPGQRVAVFPALGGEALARDAEVLAVDPPGRHSVADLGAGPGAARGVLLSLPEDSAERVLAGHGGTDGGVVVTVVAVAG